jgi:hypothetical protein
MRPVDGMNQNWAASAIETLMAIAISPPAAEPGTAEDLGMSLECHAISGLKVEWDHDR